MRYLRTIRWVVATVSLVLVSVFFLDLANLVPPFIISSILSVQAGPTFIRLLSGWGAALAGVGFVLAATVMVGRVYCSHLCPLGTLQDIFIWSAKKNFKHRKFPYSKPRYLLHYVISVIIVASAAAGSFFLLDLFEPFSAFGRILSDIVRPLFILLNNAAALILTKQQLFFLYEIPLKGLALPVVAVTTVFVGALFWLSYFYGRFFCNTICPVGGVLSLLSRFSIFRITIDNEHCIDCGLCERVCRARCIDSEKREIDFAACVGCFDCLSSCPTVGMKYSYKKNNQPAPAPVDAERRKVLTAASISMFWLAMPKETASAAEPTYDETRKTPVVAPGGRSIQHFTDHCTACHLCVSTCPTHVLQPSFLEFGIAGMMQPRMDYSVSYCNFDCTLCGQVCPTGALQPVLHEEKKLLQIGKAHFVKADCIVETKKTDCGACSEHCPTKAVKMVPYGKLLIPEVDDQYCVGCGACEHACPVTPRKAIFVMANEVHAIAKKREETKIAAPVATPEEFPF
ncbi:MAG TPA: 4Fe-4S dicluster domain-containing protein [Bacteroidota bacterium]|nr:4Fe-4S dicluster domain-containing protein [Bacteroidota bacterium]